MADMKAALMTLPASGPDTGQWPWFDDEQLAAAARVLRSGRINYWTGSEGKAFESEFAAYCGVEYGIALSNGTVALDLALEAAGIGAGDEVIVTPRTYLASAACVAMAGARPVFVDVGPALPEHVRGRGSRSGLGPHARHHRRASRRLALRHGRPGGNRRARTTC
jgi:hypothetical protein